MKKLSLIFAVAIIMMAVIASCNKKDDVMNPEKSDLKVAVIDASYVVQNGDIITMKSAPAVQTVVWTMLTDNGAFYSGDPYYTGGNMWLINGSELLTNTTAYDFWHNSANNPVSFPLGTSVYSNDTPNENLRCIAETKDANGNLVYIGMIDFNPEIASFPLSVNGFRLGDELYVDWSQIKNLPATDALSLKVTFAVSPVDVLATKAQGYHTMDTDGVPAGSKELSWVDIKYKTADAPQTIDVPGTGDICVYNTITGKIFGNVIVELYEGTELLSAVMVSAQDPGHGLRITATTTKIGAFDSGTINWHNLDITINGVPIEYN